MQLGGRFLLTIVSLPIVEVTAKTDKHDQFCVDLE